VVAWQQCKLRRGRQLFGSFTRALLAAASVLCFCMAPHPTACTQPTLQVKSTKMNRTIVVRRDYLHYIKKYQVRCGASVVALCSATVARALPRQA